MLAISFPDSHSQILITRPVDTATHLPLGEKTTARTSPGRLASTARSFGTPPAKHVPQMHNNAHITAHRLCFMPLPTLSDPTYDREIASSGFRNAPSQTTGHSSGSGTPARARRSAHCVSGSTRAVPRAGTHNAPHATARRPSTLRAE